MTQPADPRARQLAEAVHGLVRQKATKLPAWHDLPLSEREKATTEARLWLRAAVETGIAPPADRDAALASMLEGLHTLLATSSRDWQPYRVDAWLWAVLCGWDCEQDEHDETCTHGALEETAAMHGWDDDTVAKARRYRAAVRALTAPYAPAIPVTALPAEEPS